MTASAFDPEAPLDQRRAIIRRSREGTEMVELPWGMQPPRPGDRPRRVIRAEGRTFHPGHRCLVPVSEFWGRRYTASLADGDWFYFAGIWRPATVDWPEAYAILTIDANRDIAPYHDRQMAVLRRSQRLAWLDGTRPERELLRPLPAGSFFVRDDRRAEKPQAALSL